MSYVQQICDGYNKKALMGNWYEERIYPEQPFREKQDKKVTPHLYRPGTETKASPASTTPASRGNYHVSTGARSGRLQAGSFSTTEW